LKVLRQLSYELTLVAILCIIALFLFPAVQGPYSAVHGPVTALLSIKAKLFLCLTLLLATMHLLVRCVTICARGFRPRVDESFLPAALDSEHSSVLRC
jgi:succinate dehydrogenase hydrophobic anchor subunit